MIVIPKLALLLLLPVPPCTSVKVVPKHRLELDGVSELLELSELLEMDGVQMDFGFSFDAALTIDTVLYSKGLTKEDRDRWRRLRDTSSSRTN